MRRMSTFVVTAAMAAGVVFTALPAQSAVASGGITCNVAELHQQITRLRDRAARLDHSGDHSGARSARSEADALQRKMQWCIDSDNNV
ncbi:MULTISPECIES: hypothetical protein [Streptomyces]|uniref:hypothetical protein n=1 Tax=Streptomyces TaxID=1883 RepID=UPI00163BB943|nr:MULTISPECIES: hypothetical protein [Streptomyces]MBC2878958.1 hypothetical protein [Streptomyces sp. TYQ1024]UBI40691.1 hypothetical protein K7I03_32325 [Streptomyces mobaraensis]UKW33273.1 hypothetical protein MCU78_32250 [Streptomyces sp. TYQ1024]